MELKRAVCNRYMVLGIFISIIILGQTFFEYGVGMKTTDVLSIIVYPMALSGFTPFAAVFPVLPFALSFAEEYNSGYIKFQMIRKSRKQYILEKIGVVSFSGAVLMVAVFGFVFLAAIILGTPTVNDKSGFYEGMIWNPMLSVWGGKLVLLLKLILAAVFGAVWSSICLLISSVFPNRYVAFLGTFILYQGLWEVLQGKSYNPVYLLRGDTGNYVSFWHPLLIQISILLIVWGLIAFFMGRKIKDV